MTKNSKCAIDKTAATKRMPDKKVDESFEERQIEIEIGSGVGNGRGAEKRKKLLLNILQAEEACNCFVLYYMLNANEQIYSKNDIYWHYDEINRIHFVA